MINWNYNKNITRWLWYLIRGWIFGSFNIDEIERKVYFSNVWLSSRGCFNYFINFRKNISVGCRDWSETTDNIYGEAGCSCCGWFASILLFKYCFFLDLLYIYFGNNEHLFFITDILVIFLQYYCFSKYCVLAAIKILMDTNLLTLITSLYNNKIFWYIKYKYFQPAIQKYKQLFFRLNNFLLLLSLEYKYKHNNESNHNNCRSHTDTYNNFLILPPHGYLYTLCCIMNIIGL